MVGCETLLFPQRLPVEKHTSNVTFAGSVSKKTPLNRPTLTFSSQPGVEVSVKLESFSYRFVIFNISELREKSALQSPLGM